MAPFDPELAVAALHDRLTSGPHAIPGIAFHGRRLLDFDQVQAQPALLTVRFDTVDTARVEGNKPPVWTIHALVIIYAKAPDDPAEPPAKQLHAFKVALERALERKPEDNATGYAPVGALTTLGGVVRRAHLAAVHYVEGTQGGQSELYADIEMEGSANPT